MTLTQLAPPYPIFTDKSGSPLDNGYLYFGTVNLNPETNPITVYYDVLLTQPAAQPLRTSNGYVMRNGSPAAIYTNGYFSVTVRDKNKAMVIYSPSGYGITPGTSASLTDQMTYNEGGTGAVNRVLTSRLQDFVSLKDFGAVGNGVANDTAAIQAAISAVTDGQWIDGGNKTYLITTTINCTNAIFRLRNCNFVLGTSYADQGRFELNAGSGTTAMTVEMQGVYVYGGRGAYKIGLEPWGVFASFAGYDSISPALAPTFRVTAYNANTSVSIERVNFYDVFSGSCIEVGTYGTVFINDCEYKNIANKTFHVYHSPDDGVTQAGRTIVNNVYAQNVGMMPATFTVGGVNKNRADAYAPQGSFNFIVSHGDFTINNAIVWNYASCGVTADRNRSFNSNNVFIFHNDGNAFSNNPSGAFWLENCNTSNITNLFVWVTDRDSRDTALDSSLLQLYCTSDSQTNITNMVLLTSPTTAAVRKVIRGSIKDNPSINISNFYVYGITSSPTETVNFSQLPNSVIGLDAKLSGGYIRHGAISIEQPLYASVENVTMYGDTANGDVIFSVAGNPGVTGNVGYGQVTGCDIAGSITSTVNFTQAFQVIDNKRIGGSVSSAASSGIVQVSGNANIVSFISIIGTGAAIAGIANVMNNAQIGGTTIIDNCINARVSGNNTKRRIEIQDVQTFEIVGNTAKTNAAEPIIWINPSTVANILAGVISSNNVLIKTGTAGAGYVSISVGVTGVTDVNNNKLTVAWT